MDNEGVKAILDAGRASSANIVTDDITGDRFLVIPEGSEYERLPAVSPATPDSVIATVSIDDAASFAHYFNRFKDAHSTIFASKEGGLFEGLLDYHNSLGDPSPTLHRVRWEMPMSEQWRRWSSSCGKPFTQAALAEFLEENQSDVVEPDGATLLELVTNIQTQRRVVFDSAIRLRDGQQNITWKDEDDGGKTTISLPPKIAVGIPVYYGGPLYYRVEIWLRYRVNEGKISFVM